MRKIFIALLSLSTIFADAQMKNQSGEMSGTDISTLIKNGHKLFKIQVVPADSGYIAPVQADLALYTPANATSNDLISVDERASYFPNVKKLTIKFFVSQILKAEDLRYFIEENGTKKIIDWKALPNLYPVDTADGFNIYEIKNINSENRFIKIGIYNYKEPETVLYQTTSSIKLANPSLAVFFTFQKNRPDTVRVKDGMENLVYGKFIRNMNGMAFNKRDIITDRTLFIKTDNAPQLFKLFIEYGINDDMFFVPKWAKLSSKNSNSLEDSMIAAGYSYKAEIPASLVLFDTRQKMILYYNFSTTDMTQKRFSYSSNAVEFRVRYTLNKKEVFIISLVIGIPLLIIALLFIIWYKRKQKRKLQRQQQLTTEAKLKLQSIRSQLNPHFIFNALSGIQNLMHKNETDKANHYLNTFSRLTRNVLDDANKETISLDSEIKLLDDYLKMEQLRFGFQYSIHADEKLDRHNIEIPAMLLQPFAENAVKHGIASLKQNGEIKIDFKKSGNDLIMSVTDNGGGFDASKDYDGMGLTLSKNRITLLNAVHTETPLQLQIHSSQNGTEAIITLQNWLS